MDSTSSTPTHADPPRDARAPVQVEELWCRIVGIVSRTLLAIHPFLMSTYLTSFSVESSRETSASGEPTELPNNCFHILGFDLLLDQVSSIIVW